MCPPAYRGPLRPHVFMTWCVHCAWPGRATERAEIPMTMTGKTGRSGAR